MRNTLASLNTYVLLALIVGSSLAQNVQICTDDSIYRGLWRDPLLNYDASTFCNSLLSKTPVTSCLSISTSRTTTFPNAETTLTITGTTNIPSSTATTITTVTVFNVVTSSTSTPGLPNVTLRARYGRQEMEDNVKRQATTTTTSSRRSFDLTASLASACTCYPLLSPETDNVICTSTLTVTNGVITRTTSTVFKTLTSGVTTVTNTVNETAAIQHKAVAMMSSATTSWTIPIPSPTTTTTYKTTSVTTQASISSRTTTSSVSAVSSEPSGCPAINGTKFGTTSKDCTYYQRICFLTYAAGDFYEGDYNYATPEDCAAVCTAQNRGMNTACLGIVWNITTTTRANCRQLKKLTSPLEDTGSIAIILQRDSNCGSSSTTSTVSASASFSESAISTWTSSIRTTSSSKDTRPVTSSTITSGSATVTTLTTTSSNNSVASSCSPSTIFNTQFQTITITQGLNSSWVPWSISTDTSNDPKIATRTVTANATTVTITITTGASSTVATTKTLVTSSTPTVASVTTVTQRTTVTYLSVSTVTTTLSGCSASTTTTSTKGTTTMLRTTPTTTTTTTSSLVEISATSTTTPSLPTSSAITTTTTTRDGEWSGYGWDTWKNWKTAQAERAEVSA